MSPLHDALRALPVIGLLRRLPPDVVVPLALGAVEGGLRAVEVTMDSPDACGRIAALRAAVGPGVAVGAGTVSSAAEVVAAAGAGAEFLVAPDFQPDVVARAKELGVAVVPGAYTPTEILQAWRAGADLVKVFPSGPAGPGYIRALRGPMPDVPLVCTGGVTIARAPEFLAAGATAVAVGDEVFGADAGGPSGAARRIAALAAAVTAPS